MFYVCFSVVVAGVAMVMDLNNARVDNGWLLFSLGLGVIVRCMDCDLRGLLLGVAGGIFPLMLLGCFFSFHMLGAGDIKLFCVLGTLLGIKDVGKCMIVSFFLGAVFSFAILLSTGDVFARFYYLFCYIREFMQTGVKKPYCQNGVSAPENFHFTVPVFLSIVLFAGGVY